MRAAGFPAPSFFNHTGRVYREYPPAKQAGFGAEISCFQGESDRADRNKRHSVGQVKQTGHH
jgi:hypothetical protein